MPKTMKIPAIINKPSMYCPGCGHGIIQRLIAECVEELGMTNKVVFIRDYGCCSLAPRYTSYDHFQTPHGRVGSGATALSRCLPEGILTLAYQGDGGAYVIGLSETINAAYRNENFTEIIVNNRNFAMTGGQMSSTTLEGEKTTTSPYGRDVARTGLPMRYPEIVADSSTFDVAFVARGSVHSPAEINKTKGYIKKAIQKQMNKEGYSVVEILSPCPTNWHMTPVESLKSIESMLDLFPSGILRDREAGSKKKGTGI
jgi:2-oxoglutarate ferredoxin oxidoreductase subunit beta